MEKSGIGDAFRTVRDLGRLEENAADGGSRQGNRSIDGTNSGPENGTGGGQGTGGETPEKGNEGGPGPGSGPATIDPAEQPAAVKRKRGPYKPRRSVQEGAGETNGPLALGVGDLADLIQGVHAVGAASLNAPEFVITGDEAKALAKALHKVGEHYSMNVDPKTAALCGLAVTAATIYGGRGYRYYMRVKSRAQAQRPASDNVVPMVAPVVTGDAEQDPGPGVLKYGP